MLANRGVGLGRFHYTDFVSIINNCLINYVISLVYTCQHFFNKSVNMIIVLLLLCMYVINNCQY